MARINIGGIRGRYRIHTPINLRRSGFTIVELLIVVVIIGILAAISLIAYTGIQMRAENSKTKQGIALYAKSTLGYLAQKGEYPKDTGYPCLGGQTSCARTSGTGTCASNPDGPAGRSMAFDTLLQEVTPSIPQISEQTVGCAGNVYKGAYFRGVTGKDGGIVYYLKGNEQCEVAGLNIVNRVQSENMTRCGVSFQTLP